MCYYLGGDYMNNNFIITGINRVILVGKNEYKENTISFLSDLKHNELILHLSGKLTINFNGKIFNCEKDMVRFLPKGENIDYVVDYEERGECIDVFFDTDLPISDDAFVIKLNNGPIIENYFKKLFSVWVSKNEGYYFECIGLLYKIFAELSKQNYIPENQYNTIKPAISYINEKFLSDKISVPYLAKICNISESYLKKLFIKKFGIPPVKYIVQLKINYACDLLRTGLYSISDVSEICGYNNSHFFSRQFKEYLGISPTTFIEKYKSSK